MSSNRPNVEAIARELEAGLYLVPIHMWGGVKRYFLEGGYVGHFLMALFANDLMAAFAHADDVNAAAMQDWCRFLYNHVPSDSHGSPEKVAAWRARFGSPGAAVQ